MASQYSLISTIKLNNDVPMPRIHLGVYMTSSRETESMVAHALEAGYRGFDSAEWYANEKEVGASITKFLSSNTSGVKREDIWFTTKLKDNVSYDATRKKIKESIKKSGLGYIDLYLLHSPYGGAQKRKECWQAVEDAVAEGEVRVGGLQELLNSKPKIIPAVNQIEVHPFNTQPSITSFCASHNIVIEAYAPLARAMRMKHPTIIKLAAKYGCNPAQLMVRWSLQHGYVPLPKSSNEERIVANANVWGLEIGGEDLKGLDGLNEGLVTDWDPTDAP